jgi:hypothetical protein
MDKIETNQVERVLRNDELDTVTGTNPLVIRRFNPQPDPPGAPVAH